MNNNSIDQILKIRTAFALKITQKNQIKLTLIAGNFLYFVCCSFFLQSLYLLIFNFFPEISECQTVWIKIKHEKSNKITTQLHAGKLFIFFCHLLLFFKNSFRNTIKVSNNLDTDQSQHFVQPDKMSQNCLQMTVNPESANHDCSIRQILQHLPQFSKKIRYYIS